MSNLTFDILSDTHSQHNKFTCAGGDFLLHSGDALNRGSYEETLDFMLWMQNQPYTHKIFIPGNHDWALERDFEYWRDQFTKHGIHLLNDSGIELEGIKIWGSPVQPWFNSWAFNRARTEAEATTEHPWIKPHWDLIPSDTEILLTHGPAYGILDEVSYKGSNPEINVGCKELLKKIKKTQIKLHVFGHIHEGRGFQYERNTTYVNGSSLDRKYCPTDLKPMRVTREVFQDESIGYVL